MQEVTNEFKAKVFGLYMGAKYILPAHSKALATVKGDTITEIELGSGILRQLILTPLEQITDEHATELANIWVSGDMPREYAFGQIKGLLQNHDINRLFELYQIKADITLHMYDYLRSKGYHLPYMGIDLYEAGIAIKP